MIDYESIGVLIGLFDLSFNEAVLIAGKQKGGVFIQSRPLVTERQKTEPYFLPPVQSLFL